MYTALQTRRQPNALPAHLGMLGAGSPDPISMGVSAGVSLASVALSSWLNDRRQNAAAKVFTTTMVNELEPLLRANADAYRNGPGSCSDQAAALTAFDSAMKWLQSTQACGNIQLGQAGQKCITDRLPGGQWDWYAMYRNPIANDTRPSCNLSADAANQAAVANIMNAISGSNVQTNASAFQAGSNGSILSGSVNVGGTSIPTSYLLLGAGVLVLIVALS